MEFLRSFLRRHLAGKPVVASPNVGCFLRLLNCWHFFRVWALMHEWYILLLLRAQSIKAYGGVYVTLGRLWRRHEFAQVPSHGSLLVFMIPPQNVMPARVTPAWVHPGCCTGARISLRYEISQRYHVNAKRPPVSVWNRSAGRLERVAHA